MVEMLAGFQLACSFLSGKHFKQSSTGVKTLACAAVERTQSGSLLLTPERDCVSYGYVFMCFVRLH